MSQSSKALSIDMASPAGYGLPSNEDLADGLTSLALELLYPTLVDEDLLAVDPPREIGVRGGEPSVMSCEVKESCGRCVLALCTSYIDDARLPKTMSNRLAL